MEPEPGAHGSYRERDRNCRVSMETWDELEIR